MARLFMLSGLGYRGAAKAAFLLALGHPTDWRDFPAVEGEGTPPVGEIGFTLGVLQPGKPSALCHRESSQEDFLVLAGECLLLIEGEERPLKA